MKEKIYKIGELSKLTNVPVKTIRYYDEFGLLTPSYVDKYTSYRYYDYENVEKLFKILMLKDLGCSLTEIKEYEDSELLEKQKTILESQILEFKNKLKTINSLQNIKGELIMKPFINDENVIGNVFVDDKGGNYLYQQRLKIFENPAYEFTNKIAPGSTNVYHFVVHNSTNIELKYKVKMYEESEYKINMVYRLKRNNNYVLGDENNWVTARELETQFKNLDKSKSDNYSLEWMWKYEGDDESDSIAGKNMESEYKLNIRVFFEAVTNV